MDEETEREEKDAEHVAKIEERRKVDEEALERRRKKREKVKMRKQKGASRQEDEDGGAEAEGMVNRKILAPAKLGGGWRESQEDDGPSGAAVNEEIGLMIHDDD